jgi:hypothetical protein
MDEPVEGRGGVARKVPWHVHGTVTDDKNEAVEEHREGLCTMPKPASRSSDRGD